MPVDEQWSRLENLQRICRRRAFKEAYASLRLADVHSREDRLIRLASETVDQPLSTRCDLVCELISGGRIALEFKQYELCQDYFQAAVHQLNLLPESHRDGPIQAPRSWLTAIIAAMDNRINSRKVTGQQIAGLTGTDESVAAEWFKVYTFDAYEATLSMGGHGQARRLLISHRREASRVLSSPSVGRLAGPTQDSVELTLAWCRLLRRITRLNQNDPDLRSWVADWFEATVNWAENSSLYDRTIGFATFGQNVLLQQAMLERQFGHYDNAIRLFRRILPYSANGSLKSEEEQGYCHVEGTVGLALAKKMWGRSYEPLDLKTCTKSGRLSTERPKFRSPEELVDLTISRLTKECFYVDHDARTHSFSESTDPGVCLPKLPDHKQMFAHQRLATLARLKASIVAETRPEQAHRYCREADNWLTEAKFVRGWPKAPASQPDSPSVRSLNRPNYLIETGDRDGAVSEMTTVLRDLGLDVAQQRFERIIKGGDSPVTAQDHEEGYSIEDFRNDWSIIRMAVARRSLNREEWIRVFVSLVAAADLLRSLDFVKQALVWLDALSATEDDIDQYLKLVGVPESRWHEWSLADIRRRSNEPQPPDRDAPMMLRFLPLARATSIRYIIGQAEVGLIIGTEIFGKDYNEDYGSAFQPHELTRELAQTHLVLGNLQSAADMFETLSQSSWEVAAAAGVSGQIDALRRRRKLREVRALATSDQGLALPTARSRVLWSKRNSELLDSRSRKSFLEQEEPEPHHHLSPSARASVRVAWAWAEIQLGSHHDGVSLALAGVVTSPYDLSSWLGVVRGLRILGLHRKAIELLEWLLGEREVPPQDLLTDDQVQPQLWLRHEVILRTELGWCYIDLDLQKEAGHEFRAALRIGPYQVAAHRGVMHSHALEADRLPDIQEESMKALSGWAYMFVDAPALIAPDPEEGRQVRELALAKRQLMIERARLHSHRAEFDRSDDLFALANHRSATGAGDRSRKSVERGLYAELDCHLDRLRLFEADAVHDRIIRDSVHQRDSADPDDGYLVSLFQARLDLARGHSAKAVDDLKRAIDARIGLDNSPPPESLILAYVVALYEDRRFDDVLAELDAWDGLVGACSSGVGDMRRLIRAWTHLAKSELPDERCRYRQVQYAGNLIKEMDKESTAELHLLAVYSAQEVRLRASRGSHDNRTEERSSINNGIEPLSLGIAESFRFFSQALERRPFDATLWRDRAAVAMYAGTSNEVEHYLDKAHQLAPNDARIALLKGVLAYRRRDDVTALEYFRTATALDPRDYIHHRAHALAQLRLSDHAGALAAIQYGLSTVHHRSRPSLMLIEAKILLSRAAGESRRQRRSTLEAAAFVLRQPEFAKMGNKSLQDKYHLAAAHVVSQLGRVEEAESHLDKLSNKCSAEHAVIRQYIDGYHLGGSRGATKMLRWSSLALTVLSLVSIIGYYVALVKGYIEPEAVFYTPDEGEPVPLIPNSVLLFVPTLAFALLLVSLYGDKVRTLSFQDISIELDTTEQLNEIVHIDLDLSASHLLIVSGLSNYRPEVAYHEVEPRFLAPSNW